MNASSPYGPDHSLLRAVLVLLGGLGLVAAGAYLVTAIDESLPRVDQTRVAEAPTQAPPRRPAPRRASSGRGLLAPGGGSVPVGGGVPAWAGSGGSSVSSGQFAPAPQGSYDVNPDLGHADLGAPSAPSGGGTPGGGTSGGAAIADAGSPGERTPTGEAPGAGTAPSASDLSGRSFGGSATSGDAPEWRSEAQTLASRSRALSGEIARLNREEASSKEAQGERAEQPSDEASTASSRGGAETNTPGTPEEPPQVPLGGTEWLAAAGAAYALNRLRDDESEEADDEE